ncbi:MAG TPA: hypothetical protein DCR04_05905 [Flavobacteriales bacterium]|nr:hypothetical protein [Flavobacteriales bacterium]
MKDQIDTTQESFIRKDGKQYNLILHCSGYDLLDLNPEENYRFQTGGLGAIDILASHFHKEKENKEFENHMSDYTGFSSGYVAPETILLDFDVKCFSIAGGSDYDADTVTKQDGFVVFDITSPNGKYYIREDEMEWIVEVEEYEDDDDNLIEEYHFRSDDVLFYATNEAYDEIMVYLKRAVDKMNAYYASVGKRQIDWAD